MPKLGLNNFVTVLVLVVFQLSFHHATFEPPPTAALILASVDAFLQLNFVDRSDVLPAVDTILESTRHLTLICILRGYR